MYVAVVTGGAVLEQWRVVACDIHSPAPLLHSFDPSLGPSLLLCSPLNPCPLQVEAAIARMRDEFTSRLTELVAKARTAISAAWDEMRAGPQQRAEMFPAFMVEGAWTRTHTKGARRAVMGCYVVVSVSLGAVGAMENTKCHCFSSNPSLVAS
jgi:hypothetical protein